MVYVLVCTVVSQCKGRVKIREGGSPYLLLAQEARGGKRRKTTTISPKNIKERKGKGAHPLHEKEEEELLGWGWFWVVAEAKAKENGRTQYCKMTK